VALDRQCDRDRAAFGIVAGWGKYLRDVTISGNAIRKALAGIGAPVWRAKHRARDDNVIADAPRGVA